MKKTLVLLLAVWGCVAAAVSAMEFPAIEKWRPEGEIRTYTRDSLWEAINGAAELFISYGFQEMTMRDIRSGDLIVTVSIYDMGDALNAYGIYVSERGEDNPILGIGTESVLLPPYQALLLKDRYYVKMDVFEGEIDGPRGRDLLTAFSRALPGSTGLPAELQALPAGGKLQRTENYIKESCFGLSELRECVYARYGSEAKPYRLFFIARGADALLQEVEQKWRTHRSPGTVIRYRKVPYSGLVGMVLTPKGLFGVADSRDEAEMVMRLKQLTDQIAPADGCTSETSDYGGKSRPETGDALESSRRGLTDHP